MVCAQARIELEPTPPHAGDIKFDRMPPHKSQLHFYQATPMIARKIGQRMAVDDRTMHAQLEHGEPHHAGRRTQSLGLCYSVFGSLYRAGLDNLPSWLRLEYC